jgi:predicted transcriptional regulator
VKRWAALLLALAVADESRSATAYVTDQLVLGVYAQQNTQGPRLATLHSGATVDTLAVNGDSTQVRLADGTTGWVKTAYLTGNPPATVRIKQLQDELDRRLATTPGLAEAAERSEVERLTRELAKQLDQRATGGGAAAAGSARTAAGVVVRAPSVLAQLPWGWALTVLAALICGFWLGYATLARRIKYKFGGIKVY